MEVDGVGATEPATDVSATVFRDSSATVTRTDPSGAADDEIALIESSLDTPTPIPTSTEADLNNDKNEQQPIRVRKFGETIRRTIRDVQGTTYCIQSVTLPSGVLRPVMILRTTQPFATGALTPDVLNGQTQRVRIRRRIRRTVVPAANQAPGNIQQQPVKEDDEESEELVPRSSYEMRFHLSAVKPVMLQAPKLPHQLGFGSRRLSLEQVVSKTKKERDERNSAETSSQGPSKKARVDASDIPKQQKKQHKKKTDDPVSDAKRAEKKRKRDEKETARTGKQRKTRPVFSQIIKNTYAHRTPRRWTADTVPICNCNPRDPKSSCGDNCLNRVMYYECLEKYCPCASLCKNRRFQLRQHASVEAFDAGKKGWGLKAAKPIEQGDFVIEYVGEVIDTATCQERLREAQQDGTRNFYFLTLDATECIDASNKGNLARFINHSCDPNCATQKWWVNGEIRVGIFAEQNIKVGEEITFDYKFERFGGKKQKCYCGTDMCRGFLGAKPKKKPPQPRTREKKIRAKKSRQYCSR
eukprot:TRINITY_DN6266_c0_g1_i1.p1 TRINITY_DN6266_c0_g1~~TRINITY_DN6266_c0_g1_i1.p1  ORF type:complete len:527 (-),score=84.32 TRINITY_DN6266_c0_g1_i1:484-2064(-)